MDGSVKQKLYFCGVFEIKQNFPVEKGMMIAKFSKKGTRFEGGNGSGTRLDN